MITLICATLGCNSHTTGGLGPVLVGT